MFADLPSATRGHVSVEELTRQATLTRIACIKMVLQAKSGHLASALGLADLYTVLYQSVLSVRPFQPNWKDRDYLLVSNGHSCAVWYATLAAQGFFPKHWLSRFRQLNSPLQGHPHFFQSIAGTGIDEQLAQPVPGIENTSGPLGQGLSQAAGLALGLLRQKRPNHVFCILSDAEHQEGQIWEAYQFAHHYQLTNLTPIIDINQIQISGTTDQVASLDNIPAKLRAFGWDIWEIDGHDSVQMTTILHQLKKQRPRKPTAVVLHTVPGKGVSFMEKKVEWHGKPPSPEQARQAIAELSAFLPPEPLKVIKEVIPYV